MTAPKTFADCKTLEDFEAFFPARTLPPGAEVTRIAPSPTGMPHIGTAMQAVLHTAVKRKTDGIFILRIEDTDQARTVPGAVDAIIDSLKWLHLSPTEGERFGGSYGPYTQTARLPLYKLAAQKLIDTGHAYPCFCTEERLDLIRKTQQAQHQTPGYDGHCRNIPKEEAAARVAKGEKHVVRFKMPKGEKITFHDEVRGDITFESDVLDDSVILKSDGVPTYHLAAMVDDHFMRVTIVIRGEEWISSAPKHILIYRAFGWTPPKFLHTVLLRNKERQKLGKRTGDTSLAWFRKQGIIPEALCNFLYRVMWAHPEGKDIYPLDEFAQKLDFSGLPTTGPVADFDLLSFINGKYLNALPPADLKRDFLAYLDWMIEHKFTATSTLHQDEEGVETTVEETVKLRDALKADPAYADAVLAVAVQRATRFADLIFGCRFYFDYGYTPPAAEKLAKEADKTVTVKILTRILELFTKDEDAPQLEAFMKQTAKELGLKDRAVFMTVRLAMTGEEKTPPHSEVAGILKLARVRERIGKVLAATGAEQAA
jgi:glutamyl-tRNA synthetase